MAESAAARGCELQATSHRSERSHTCAVEREREGDTQIFPGGNNKATILTNVYFVLNLYNFPCCIDVHNLCIDVRRIVINN